MIYFFYGSDEVKSLEKALGLVSSLRAKKPDAAFFRLDRDFFKKGELTELAASTPLFEKRYIVFGNTLSENEGYETHIIEHAADLAESPNIFIFVEKEPKKEILSALKKHAEKVLESSKKDEEKKDYFNIFLLADAVGGRNKKEAWVLLQKAYQAGLSPDEIFPALFWQVKNILLVKENESANPEALGMKSYPFRKAVLFSKNFSKEELQNLSRNLTKIFHDDRLGNTELEFGLEKIALSL